MKKQYAFLLMGEHYDPAAHRHSFETERDIVHFLTVRDAGEARDAAVALKAAGVGAIEVCGAFGPDLARKLADLTDNEVAVGYVVHDKKLDGVFARFFGA